MFLSHIRGIFSFNLQTRLRRDGAIGRRIGRPRADGKGTVGLR